MRPVRSWLFVPTSQEKFLSKVRTLPVDGVFLDLEDGVPPAEKSTGRQLLRAFVAAGPPDRPITYVRVNKLGDAAPRDDLEAAAGVEGVVLPKVESPDDIHRLAAELSTVEDAHGLTKGSTKVIAAIESARGLLAAPAIALADERVSGLLFGAEDYALDIGLPPNRRGLAAELLYARSAVVNAARAAGRMAIDGVYPALHDDEALKVDTGQARDLGFTGKSLFHPQQITLINEIFSPWADELAYSQEIVEAFDAAHAAGSGAVSVRGQLVDLPIVERARRTLAYAKHLAAT